MLDDANVIAQRDPQGALGFAAHQPEQLTHDFGIATQSFDRSFDNVVFAGMGGSALSAELLRTYPKLSVPFEIVKGYDLPAYVSEKTLVICSSYSGNTEEELSVLEHEETHNVMTQAEEKNVCIAVIAHGGKLAERARGHYMFAEIPECPQPRVSVFYSYRALVEILVAAKLVDGEVLGELAGLVEPLEQAISSWLPSVPTEQNYAKQLAEKAIGKTPIIYAGPLMYPAAYKWKISFNENAKNTAWCNYLPEFNHNEFIGWSSHPIEKPFAVFDLLSSFENERVLKRFEVSDRLLSGMRPKSHEVHAEGSTVLEQLLYLVLLGDFMTTYTALLNGVNPTPVDLVEKFKKELA